MNAQQPVRVLAVDIGGTYLKSALLKAQEPPQQPQLSQPCETPSEAHRGAPAMLAHLHELIGQYDPSAYDAIGISTAGTVDPEQGVIVYANDNIPQYTGTPLKALLEQRYHKPVQVQNDGKAAALGELHYGAGCGFQSLICAAYGTGIGGAVIAKGAVHYGTHGGAGAVGHILTHAGGRLCTCGQHGCYESYASVNALMALLKENNLPYQTGRQLMEALLAPDAAASPLARRAEEVLDQWILEVVYGLVSLAHTFQPQAFILGGGIMEQPRIIEKIRSELPRHLMPSFQDTAVLPARLGNRAALYGMLSVIEETIHETV